ncbi:hypothetical protein PtA15_7A628 [Puccinia triticina]|uniref:Uncharacterized protein n=1 Tax=Puccinia triticina TaxID=208348 RepID=A0ABY7CP00_9BASI|nr:uncharacterized protein PtA15_7A628 [Puccinia triticina]WAQ86899.1 hypothetical protein PtA15_7A628 [Puccinia triticina]
MAALIVLRNVNITNACQTQLGRLSTSKLWMHNHGFVGQDKSVEFTEPTSVCKTSNWLCCYHWIWAGGY